MFADNRYADINIGMSLLSILKASVNLEHFLQCDVAYFGPRCSIIHFMHVAESALLGGSHQAIFYRLNICRIDLSVCLSVDLLVHLS